MSDLTPSRPASSRGGDCHWVQAELHAFLEGEAAPLSARLVSEHLGRCQVCAAELSALQEERIAVLESLISAPQLPGDFAARVSRRIARAERVAQRRERRTRLARWSAAAAVVLAAASAAFFRAPPSDGEPSPAPAAPASSVAIAVDSRPPVPVPHLAAASHEPRREHPADGFAGEVQLATFGAGRVASFGHVIDIAHRIAPDVRRASSSLRDDPCKPDPNKDGRTDITDVAYSCQVLLGGQRVMAASLAGDHSPLALESASARAELADCDEACVRA